MSKTANMPNYKRYIFNEDGTEINRATGLPLKKEPNSEKYRLTNDEGKREYIYPDAIAALFVEPEPVEAPKPEATEPAKEKTPRVKKSDNQSVKHGNRFLNYNGNGKRRVIDEEVREIRKLAKGNPDKGIDPMPQKQICIEFQIHNSTCSNIIKGKLHPNIK